MKALPGPQLVVSRDSKHIATRFSDKHTIEAEPVVFTGMPLVAILCSFQRNAVVSQKANHIPMSANNLVPYGCGAAGGKRLQSQ